MTDTSDTKMEIWDALKTPPEQATKAIQGGRLKGKTDINPQWRLRAMTEQFGPCGVGWRYVIEKLWTVPVGPNGEVAAFAEVSVYVKGAGARPEEWSVPIPGIGGNMLVDKESSGLHINDECFKMAVTDALSVAFKALGVAADVYMGKFDSKYDKRGGGSSGGGTQRTKRQPRDEGLGKCPKCGTFLAKRKRNDGSGSFLSCQGYPGCKYSCPLPKDGAAKAAPPEQGPGPRPVEGSQIAAQEPEEMCHACGSHPINPDGYCPNEGGGESQPQGQAPQEWRPQCCGRTMMPRPSTGGEAPRWHCPKCRKTQGMSEEERKRVGL